MLSSELVCGEVFLSVSLDQRLLGLSAAGGPQMAQHAKQGRHDPHQTVLQIQSL